MNINTPTQPARYLIDSNLLLRISDPASSMHRTAHDAISTLTASGAVLCITAQNLVEFWNAATRPAEKNGLGISSADAQIALTAHKAAFTLLPDSPAILPQWERLVSAYNVRGVQVHDTRLTAVALVYKVENILTFNLKDFRRFAPEGLTIVDPATITAARKTVK